MAELQKSLRLVDDDKATAMKDAKKEVERLADKRMEELKKYHYDALVKAKDQCYAKAISNAADELDSMKNKIYQAGYE